MKRKRRVFGIAVFVFLFTVLLTGSASASYKYYMFAEFGGELSTSKYNIHLEDFKEKDGEVYSEYVLENTKGKQFRLSLNKDCGILYSDNDVFYVSYYASKNLTYKYISRTAADGSTKQYKIPLNPYAKGKLHFNELFLMGCYRDKLFSYRKESRRYGDTYKNYVAIFETNLRTKKSKMLAHYDVNSSFYGNVSSPEQFVFFVIDNSVDFETPFAMTKMLQLNMKTGKIKTVVKNNYRMLFGDGKKIQIVTETTKGKKARTQMISQYDPATGKIGTRRKVKAGLEICYADSDIHVYSKAANTKKEYVYKYSAYVRFLKKNRQISFTDSQKSMQLRYLECCRVGDHLYLQILEGKPGAEKGKVLLYQISVKTAKKKIVFQKKVRNFDSPTYQFFETGEGIQFGYYDGRAHYIMKLK